MNEMIIMRRFSEWALKLLFLRYTIFFSNAANLFAAFNSDLERNNRIYVECDWAPRYIQMYQQPKRIVFYVYTRSNNSAKTNLWCWNYLFNTFQQLKYMINVHDLEWITVTDSSSMLMWEEKKRSERVNSCNLSTTCYLDHYSMRLSISKKCFKLFFFFKSQW